MNFSDNYNNLYKAVYDLYHLPDNKSKLLFHGWHHIQFVNKKAIEFAIESNCDIEKAAAAALVHDLNYIFPDRDNPDTGRERIIEYLITAGYDKEYAQTVAKLIEDIHLEYRASHELSAESKALADADVLFKAIPTTPILFSSKFITQKKYDVAKLAHEIIDWQKPLLDADIYFYSETAKKKYLKWAKINLLLWECVLESLDDEDIKEMLATAYDLEIL